MDKKYCIANIRERKDGINEIYWIINYDGYRYEMCTLDDMKKEKLQPHYFNQKDAIAFIENSIYSMTLGSMVISVAFEFDNEDDFQYLREKRTR